MFRSHFKPAVRIIKKLDKVGEISRSLDALQRQDVLVGIPQEESSRPQEEPNNAELAFLHSVGSPAQNIPARPFLQPAINANIDKIAKIQALALKAALDGNKTAVGINIEKVGMLTQNVIKAWFVDPRNGWPPNSPVTIARKGSDKPLIDTGQLRNAIHYVLRRK